MKQLWGTRKTKQVSLDALRRRAMEGLLAFIDGEGRYLIFDQVLSLIRIAAAAKCRRPRVTWQRIARAMKLLDKDAIDQKLIDLLNSGASNEKAIRFLVDKINTQIAY